MTLRAPLTAMVLLATALSGAGCSDAGGSGQAGVKPFDAMSPDEHLDCAVHISAYTYLIVGGQVAKDDERYSQSLLALGWHHNAYAIPLGKGEQHDLINKRRAALIAEENPETIAARAIDCIVSAEAKAEAS